MNRIYHLVFNRALGLLQVAPETARAHKKSVTASRLVGAVFSLGLLAGTGTAMAITHYINDDEIKLVNGSTWNAGSKLILVVGHTNNGTLRIENGGKVINWNVGEIGANSGSTGTATVSGAGSEWKNSDWLTVGESGTGTLHIADGGRVESDYGYIGKYLGSIGTATVSGTGSEWKNSSDLSVGDYGTGTLNIAGDGKVENKDGYIGRYNGSIGAVTVSGVNSSWVNSGNLRIGSLGEGTLNIENGGSVSNGGYGEIGVNPGSTGTVTVSGPGSEWKGSAWLYVGKEGTGTLHITDGGRVESSRGYIGNSSGSTGTVTITGADSVWKSSVSMLIGREGTATGTLNIGASMDNAAMAAGKLEAPQLIFGAGSGTLNFNHTDSNYIFDTRLGRTDNGTHKLNHWAGTTTLTGDNSSFSGTTTVGGGTLQAGANNAFANNTAYVINGGTLDLNNHDLTMSSLSGNGGSVKLGTAALTVDQASDTTYAGDITGSNNLIKKGGGTLALSGDNSSFSGTTTVEGGILLVNGSNKSSTHIVKNGATLGGSGTVGNTSINDGGTLSPGNSIGTLRVDGDLTFAADSVYKVEVDPSGIASDLVYVTGTAYLNGTVAHIGLGGTDDYAANSKYRILSAEGGLSGRFNSVSSAFTFLDADLTYDTSSSLHGVDLILKRNDLKFSNKRFAGTRNQQATAMGVESLPAAHRLYGSVLTHTGSDAALSAIYDKLSGEIHASVHAALVEDSRLLRLAVNERLRAAAGEATAPMKTEVNPVKQHSASDSSTAWVQAVGNWGETNGNANAASLDRDTKGIVAGIDRQISEQTRAGALLGYTRSSINAGSARGSASSDTAHLGIYAGTRLDNGPGREQGQGELALRGGLFYGYHDIETKRHVQLGALNERLEAQRAAHSLHAYAELAYRVDAGSLAVEPFANLAHVYQRSQGGRERATGSGETALRSKKPSTDTSFVTLGVRPSVEVPLGNATANIYGSIGWQHALGDTTPKVDQRFSAGNTFTVAGTPIASNAAVVEAGVKLKINDRASLDFSYAGKHGSRVKDHGGRAGLQWRF